MCIRQTICHVTTKCVYKYIVEGANLFFTEDSRLVLEASGAIIYKDASANKGGVTSSSYEVIASLVMTDEQHFEHLRVTDGKEPEFRAQYVKETLDNHFIRGNARLEFECIWQEHEKSGTPRCILTDQVSTKLNTLNTELISSSLFADMSLRRKVIMTAIPKCLVHLCGEDQICLFLF